MQSSDKTTEFREVTSVAPPSMHACVRGHFLPTNGAVPDFDQMFFQVCLVESREYLSGAQADAAHGIRIFVN